MAFILVQLCPSSTTANPSIKPETSGYDRCEVDESDRLVVLWTTADREVFLKMIYMYALNSRKSDWWKEVIIVG